MTAYYNEIDPYAAQWLRNLVNAGHIAPGDVDERSIVDVRADDLKGYVQCHFFAGIGGWSIALRLAGWPDDRPVWTGTCPCQPFQRRRQRARRPMTNATCGLRGFLSSASATLQSSLESRLRRRLDGAGSTLFSLTWKAEGYACGATVLPACGVGAPHIRQRLWFVADADGRNASAERLQRSGQHGQQPQDSGSGEMANPNGARRPDEGQHERGQSQFPARPAEHGGTRELADSPRGGRREECQNSGGIGSGNRSQGIAARLEPSGVLSGFWRDAEWIACTDGKARPVGPGSFPLGHGIQRRASKLRTYGNAIVPQVAEEFIRAAT